MIQKPPEGYFEVPGFGSTKGQNLADKGQSVAGFHPGRAASKAAISAS